MNKPELLAPAGDLEKLKMALLYGADAVYLGGEQFGLRALAKNFTLEEMEEGIRFAHSRGKKVYITLNIIPHNEDLVGLEEYLIILEKMRVDAVIVADTGIFSIVKKTLPNMEIHLSTQSNTTNYAAANFWYDNGVKRIVTAREMSLSEIRELKEKTPEDLDIESFVHGAMCISYSGRCLLSNYMTGRDANRGSCAQSCRWKYYIVEEKRPGEYFPIVEDDRGTYIFNSKDLCMIGNIGDLVEAGITSFKIEGRMKSPYYIATVIRSYRLAIDDYFDSKETKESKEYLLSEIKKSSYRDFTTGFYYNKPDENDQLYASTSYIRVYEFTALVIDYDLENKIATVEQRNRFFKGDELEVFGPEKEFYKFNVDEIWNEKNESLDVAPRAKEILKIKLEYAVEPGYIIRKRVLEGES